MADKDTGLIELNRREHSEGLGVPAKRVFPWGFDGANLQPLSVDSGGGINLGSSSATIHAVVNTGAVGIQNSMVTLNAGPNQIGSVTVSNIVNSIVTVANPFNGLVTINPRTDYVGLMSISGNVAQSGSWDIRSLNSAATLYAVVNTGAGNSNVTLNPGPNQIGSVTISHPLTIAGFSGPTIYAVVNTGAAGVQDSLVTINPRTDYIGLMSISGGITNLAGTAQIGSVTVSNIVGGIVTIAPRTDYIGLVSISGSVVNLSGTAQIGSVTVSNTINALATTTNTFLSSNYTTFSQVLSSVATLFTPPNGQRWVLKDLIISSMGNTLVKISTHTVTRIPYMALATQGGFVSNFGDSGLRGNVSGAFVVTLDSVATVAVSANVRFES